MVAIRLLKKVPASSTQRWYITDPSDHKLIFCFQALGAKLQKPRRVAPKSTGQVAGCAMGACSCQPQCMPPAGASAPSVARYVGSQRRIPWDSFLHWRPMLESKLCSILCHADVVCVCVFSCALYVMCCLLVLDCWRCWILGSICWCTWDRWLHELPP